MVHPLGRKHCSEWVNSREGRGLFVNLAGFNYLDRFEEPTPHGLSHKGKKLGAAPGALKELQEDSAPGNSPTAPCPLSPERLSQPQRSARPPHAPGANRNPPLRTSMWLTRGRTVR